MDDSKCKYCKEFEPYVSGTMRVKDNCLTYLDGKCKEDKKGR